MNGRTGYSVADMAKEIRNLQAQYADRAALKSMPMSPEGPPAHTGSAPSVTRAEQGHTSALTPIKPPSFFS